MLLGFELTSCNDSEDLSIVISGTDSSASANKSALGETPKHYSSDTDINNKEYVWIFIKLINSTGSDYNITACNDRESVYNAIYGTDQSAGTISSVHFI